VQRIRVLLVEDDEDDAVLVRDLLAEASSVAYEVAWVRDWIGCLAALERPAHDACLLDYRLGGHDGLEVLRRAMDLGYPAPIIVLTGHDEREIDEGALGAGAADFLTKADISATVLDRALRYAIRHRQVLEALRASEQERRRLSTELLTAQEMERRAVGRDIHDSIGQSLAAAKYVLESTLVARPGGPGDEVAGMIGRVVGMLQNVLGEASRLQSGLQPAMLDAEGIGPTLTWFCGEFRATYTGIEVTSRLDVAEETLPPSLKAVIFRIVQESFANVAKHSGARAVHLELSARPPAARTSLALLAGIWVAFTVVWIVLVLALGGSIPLALGGLLFLPAGFLAAGKVLAGVPDRWTVEVDPDRGLVAARRGLFSHGGFSVPLADVGVVEVADRPGPGGLPRPALRVTTRAGDRWLGEGHARRDLERAAAVLQEGVCSARTPPT
jgi:signal transduction histidine kinase